MDPYRNIDAESRAWFWRAVYSFLRWNEVVFIACLQHFGLPCAVFVGVYIALHTGPESMPDTIVMGMLAGVFTSMLVAAVRWFFLNYLAPRIYRRIAVYEMGDATAEVPDLAKVEGYWPITASPMF